MNSSKVKIDEEIPELSFLADTSHRIKVVDKHIFSMVSKSRAQKCGCSLTEEILGENDKKYKVKNN